MLGEIAITIKRKTTETSYVYGRPVQSTYTSASAVGSVQRLSGTKQEIEMFGARISKMRKVATLYALVPGDIVTANSENYEVETVFDNFHSGFSTKHYLAYMQKIEEK